MDNIREALKKIGEKNGVEIELNEEGACALPLAGDRVLQIQLQENTGDLVLVAMIGEVPDEVRAAVFEMLLAANYYWKETLGATIAFHRGLDQVLLSYPIPVATTDEATLETVFDNFMTLQDTWTKRLAEEIVAASEARAGDDVELADAIVIR